MCCRYQRLGGDLGQRDEGGLKICSAQSFHEFGETTVTMPNELSGRNKQEKCSCIVFQKIDKHGPLPHISGTRF